MRSKAWLAARVSLRLARLPRTAGAQPGYNIEHAYRARDLLLLRCDSSWTDAETQCAAAHSYVDPQFLGNASFDSWKTMVNHQIMFQVPASCFGTSLIAIVGLIIRLPWDT
jgi:hypothetical protein